jgi:hypothetical protein
MMDLSQPYEGLSDFPMEAIAEEEEDEDEDDDADGSSSSGSGTEFIPSAWNREATPNRSALRSPDKKSVSIQFFYFMVQTIVGFVSL